MTTCLRVPGSLQDADAVVVACSGQADWRPLFVLGLEAAVVVVVAAVLLLVLAVWALRSAR